VIFLSNAVAYQSFAAGVVGSFSYFIALKLGFIGGDQRDTLLSHFRSPYLIGSFLLIGGAIATVFQETQPSTFLPVQSLILGITWPILVSQYVQGAKGVQAEKYVEDILKGGGGHS
jgi:uncharacterized membrane protein